PSLPSEPAAPVESEPAPSVAQSSSSSLSTITSVRYRANDTGGTVLIEANGPIAYTTRTNPELKQMIVEIPESILPKRLQRPLNTRDIQGTIGAIDPYQNSGSNVSRFVIQLRDGAPEPVVQQEGNTVLIVANTTPEDYQASLVRGEAPVNADLNSGQVLASHSLDEYLSNNTKFYGKKISIEVNNMDVGDAFRFITEESGVNMVLAEDVKGTVSLKLRQVPWDQALVVLMKAKSLGYTRQGNVLRIAPLDQLRKEEDEATKIALSRKTVEALKVRVYPVSYAQVDEELVKKIQNFLSERGKVVVDKRTSSVIVTDMEDNLTRVGQLIQSLDLQPPQVLIEGRIVEAKESFLREVGVNWGMNGGSFQMGTGPQGPIALRPSLGINPLTSTAGRAGTLGLVFGTLDGLGNLNATLALNEQEGRVRIISSPRILAMSNEKAKITQSTEVPVTFKPLEMFLDVTPQITSDASVMMKVQMKRQFPGERDPSTGEFAVNTREADTRVLVKNGETAVIGGVYQSDESEGETGVPWLKEIPVVGALFRARSISREKTELLVFLTPRILSSGDRGNETLKETSF
ncbi:MAG TPA: type IV pilus secretin PilQ, partial [Pseudobdellovibrionaceae bacterium]|nr:type IV pilus secretin PilQ [Pseudobdellovibrionaceae bacterium]